MGLPGNPVSKRYRHVMSSRSRWKKKIFFSFVVIFYRCCFLIQLFLCNSILFLQKFYSFLGPLCRMTQCEAVCKLANALRDNYLTSQLSASQSANPDLIDWFTAYRCRLWRMTQCFLKHFLKTNSQMFKQWQTVLKCLNSEDVLRPKIVWLWPVYWGTAIQKKLYYYIVFDWFPA